MRAIAALSLDHVRAPAARSRQFAAIGLLALVMAVLGWLRLTDLREEEQSLRGQSGRAAARAAAGSASQAKAPAPQYAPPWDSLFGALEAAAGPDVGLLALDPAPDLRTLRLEGEARNLQALLDYLRRVGTVPPFVHARLQRHQVVQESPRHPVRFTLELLWREQR